nr:HAMP domain-containing sensor histidine kinase [Sphingomonas jejuensis]
MAAGTALAGSWRLSAVPVFDHRTGRFTGYRGSARRPRADEQAGQGGLFGLAADGGSLQQLVHEIRTPLNAIVGFGEMIEHAVLGPAPRDERERAGRIVADARRLVEAVEDLDTAARLAGGKLATQIDSVDPDAFTRAIATAATPAARERGVTLTLDADPALVPILADGGRLERMGARLVTAALLTAAPGETVTASLGGDLDHWRLDVTRSMRLAGRTEADLLDPDLGADEEEGGPILGLAFSLRLVRSLAEAAGGRLEIAADRFTLAIPSARPVDASIGA